MSFERARAVADAVLYEGYALYPYRATSLKNRARLSIGSLYPASCAAARDGFEPAALECECLLEASAGALLEARLRFLQSEAPDGAGWESALPREVDSGPLAVSELAARPHSRPFAFAGNPSIEGELTIFAEPLGGGVQRLRIVARNLTPLPPEAAPEAARLRSLGSAHALLWVRGGAFVSLLDPPAVLAAAAEATRNTRVWPVLAAEPGRRDIVLCSPILLDDHPRVAPESPGDFFDATEMDEMLVLRILTLTEDERREAAAQDERVRALLERIDGLGPEQLARLHGAVRQLRPVAAHSRGFTIRPGDRVRLRPAGRSDVLDLALAGLTATVSSIEQDFEDRTFVTVLIDDDPGRDLGAQGWPGHRFFFRPDEVEPLLLPEPPP